MRIHRYAAWILLKNALWGLDDKGGGKLVGKEERGRYIQEKNLTSYQQVL